ncbi:MAG TPA: sigma-70 family RNA polymerase sigma factor [Candidatus Dormibacteraeota bacterium]
MTTIETDSLTQRFEASRPRLQALALRMLGSHADADDAVQETWLRLSRADAGAVENLGGWLTAVLARICLDQLRARRFRREDFAGDQLADEIVGIEDEFDPEQQTLLAESVGSALLVVLDMLAPTERVVFVLHDIFAMPFDDIGPIVGRSPSAARQIASRARRRLHGADDTADSDLTRGREVAAAFLAASRAGNFDALMSLLDPDVVVRSDDAAIRGARQSADGAVAVATWFSKGARGLQGATIDNAAGIVWAPGGVPRGVLAMTITDGTIVEINLISDPERIRNFDIVLTEG